MFSFLTGVYQLVMFLLGLGILFGIIYLIRSYVKGQIRDDNHEQ